MFVSMTLLPCGGSLARRPRPKTVGRRRPRDLWRGFSQYSRNVLRCSGIAVIFVLHECALKIRREAFATTETSLGKPYRVPKGHLKLVPRPRWSLGACRPVSGCRLLSSGSGPGSPIRKGVCKRLGVSRLKQDASGTCSDVSLVTLALRGIFRVPYWAPFGVLVIR
ncbi:hypothetical protein CDL15_Pgr026343 [Punica granatum]|uniref:Uncharacterized protein n=1 Tax=Punica granatum TaxID=22663 RepID=A0A218WPW2_PUNGR|nr:hypothetical protein CDL15_Pgr026343 [Punica granatum]